MKSYTDLNQSKKLAEILPMGSADMFWVYDHNIHTYDDIPKILVVNNWDDDCKKDIPCWSLATLLNALPSSTLDSSNDHYYRLYCMERFTEWYDNAVDTCYEMILKLNEQKLL